MRASYPRAIELLAMQGDCGWAYADDLTFPEAARLVVDLFHKPPRIVAFDVRMHRTREGIAHGR
ncbi:MAG: hypothetical protein WBA68_04505 [Alteraurantiacibacter sp.]